jgi:hypothetical protein
VATLAGVDTAGAVAGAREVLAGADAAAGIDNAPWSLARGLRLAQVELGRDAVVHVAGDARLAAFAEWACRTQAATLAGGDASTSPARALPSTMVAGDEEWIEALARGSRDRVVLLWRAQDAPGVADALARFAGSAGQLVIRVQLPSADARWVGAACALWLRAVACLALLEDRQPGPLRALPAWEAALAGEAG